MIPGVGPYSALITPIAGSLFHAVFHRELSFDPVGFQGSVLPRSKYTPTGARVQKICKPFLAPVVSHIRRGRGGGRLNEIAAYSLGQQVLESAAGLGDGDGALYLPPVRQFASGEGPRKRDGPELCPMRLPWGWRWASRLAQTLMRANASIEIALPGEGELCTLGGVDAA